LVRLGFVLVLLGQLYLHLVDHALDCIVHLHFDFLLGFLSLRNHPFVNHLQRRYLRLELAHIDFWRRLVEDLQLTAVLVVGKGSEFHFLV
jgi:hypothetical protein